MSAEKTARNERLWMRYYHLSPERGKDTLALIVDEETNNMKAWLLRAEKQGNRLDATDHAAVSLTCGYLLGCIKGALSGRECPKEDDVPVADQS